jgi:hypothetical protein
MQKILVQSVDLFVHPFYATRFLSKRLLKQQPTANRRFLKWLSGVWGKSIINAARKKNNLFVLVTWPNIDDAGQLQLEKLKQFAAARLGKRFRPVKYGLAEEPLKGAGKPVELNKYPFADVQFTRKNPIRITSWGEEINRCPVWQAEYLQEALQSAGIRATIKQRTERSVKIRVRPQINKKRMGREFKATRRRTTRRPGR